MKRARALIVRVGCVIAYPVLGIMLHNSHRVRVLIMFEEEILLQRSSVGHQKWSVPGGGVEKNESDEEAAIREIEEEVGIKINKKDLKKLGWRRVPYNKGWPYINLTFFEVNLSKKPKISITRPLEIIEADWFRIGSLPGRYSKTVDMMLEQRK